MARVRAIEGGFSLVRSVRWATSGAYDALGRARATASFFEGERTMIASVPATRIPTLYAGVGETVPPAAAIVVLAAIALLVVRRRRAHVSSGSIVSVSRHPSS
jgi:apolipoprotein N-acyltransferase